MVKTGNGRRKIVIEDVIRKIEQIHLARERRDAEGVDCLSVELKDLVLTGIKTGDFQGLTARTVARMALEEKDLSISN